MSSKISSKRIFITGGAGFIGSTVIGMLVEDNDITVYDSLRRNALSGRSYEHHPRLRILQGDVLDAFSLRQAMEGANLVVHCAAIAGIDTVIKRPTETMRINMLGTANVLEAARHLPDLERVVNFSTSEVFGRSAFRADEANLTEIGAMGEARWTYAVSKLAAEHLAKAYHQEFGLPVVTLRPFTIFGLAQTVVRVLGSSSNIRFTNKTYADVELRVPSVKKALELIGFEAKVDLEEGIHRTAEYYRNHHD
jgi:UDP-glucose 4-epimerase